MNARFRLAKHHRTHFFYMWNVYLITKYHYVRENTAYSKDFIWAIYGFHQADYVSYINIFKNMLKIHREIGPLWSIKTKQRMYHTHCLSNKKKEMYKLYSNKTKKLEGKI